ALARSFVVNASGDLYAYDNARWYRLTRTSGAVVGALAAPAAHQIAYLTYENTKRGRTDKIGIVDLARGRGPNPARIHRCSMLDCVGKCALPIELAFSTGKQPGFWLQACAPARWRQLDDDAAAHDLPVKSARPAGAWLETKRRTVRLHRLPVANVSADWD